MHGSKILAVIFLSAVLSGPNAVQANSAGKPMITQNPDGTFSVRHQNGNVQNAKINRGLTMPPQVVAPIIPATTNKPNPPLQQKGQ